LLEEELAETRTEREKLERYNSDLQLTLGQFDIIFKSSQEEMTRKDIEIAELSDQIEKLREVMPAHSDFQTNSDLKEQLAQANAKLERLSTLELQNAGLSVRLESAERLIQLKHQKSIPQLSDEDELRDLKSRLSQSEIRESVLQAENEAQRERLNVESQRIKDLLAQKATPSPDDELQQLRVENARLQSDALARLALESSLNSRAGQIGDILKENENLKARLARLETSALQTELEQLLAEKADLTSEIFDLKSALKRESQNTKRDTALLSGQIRRFESEKNALAEQIQSDRQELEVRESELKSLRKEFQTQFAELQEVKRLLAAENCQNEALRIQLRQTVSVALLVSETERQIGELQSSGKTVNIERKDGSGLIALQLKVRGLQTDLLELREIVKAMTFPIERPKFVGVKAQNGKKQANLLLELKRRLADEERRNAELEKRVKNMQALEANHTRALKLLGEYHCRICLLTDPQRPSTAPLQ
jgi:hypothetical protein